MERRVLILAPYANDASTISEAIRRAGIESDACVDVGELCAGIGQGAALAVVTEEALATEDDMSALNDELGVQPGWSDFPVVLLLSSSGENIDPTHRLADLSRVSHLSLLYRPMQINALVTTVRAVFESRLRQYQCRDLNKTLEKEVTVRTAMAERRARDLVRLAGELSDAEHRERKELAATLHDDLQQLLLSARFKIHTLGSEDRMQARGELDGLITECLRFTRDLSRSLSPPIIDHGTVPEIMEWLGEWYSDKHALSVSTEVVGKPPALDQSLKPFLFKAVRELLLNVVKHSGSDEANITTCWNGKDFKVRVEDGGTGFEPAVVVAMLEQPEGFGLFSIKERLDALGGRLMVERTMSGGARFVLSLPADRLQSVERDPAASGGVDANQDSDAEVPDESPAMTAAGGASRTTGRTVRILVAEDHKVVRESLIGALRRHHQFIEVVGQAGNGREAISQADRLQPDAVIMDVDMPVMDGIEATRRIKKKRPGIIVIGLSVHEEQAVKRSMLEAGADSYVSKNADIAELVEEISSRFHR